MCKNCHQRNSLTIMEYLYKFYHPPSHNQQNLVVKTPILKADGRIARFKQKSTFINFRRETRIATSVTTSVECVFPIQGGMFIIYGVIQVYKKLRGEFVKHGIRNSGIME